MSAEDRSRNLLGVFAKQPIAGHVKTRLAAATSPEFASRVAEACLRDTLERVSGVQAARAIVFAPATSLTYFKTLAEGQFDLMPQIDGDLGDRLKHFFSHARQQGFEAIVAIGTDSPNLPVECIERAFQLLRSNAVVIGPASDGGYYLVGCARTEVDIFTDIPWSTSEVLAATFMRASEAGARLAMLPPWYDVDSVEDWVYLCDQIKSMWRSGMDPAVPRVERLVNECTSPPVVPTER